MIKQARVARNVSGPGWLAVGALALGLLPLAPTFAQVSVSTTPPATDANDPAAPRAADVAPAPVPPVPAGISVETSAAPEAGAGLPPVAPVAARPGAEGDLDVTIINDLKTKTATVKAGNRAGEYVAHEEKLEKARQEARNQVHELSMRLKLAEQRLADLDRAARQADAEAGKMKGKLAKPGMPTPPMALTPPAAPGYYPSGANNGLPGASSYTRAGGAGWAPGGMPLDPTSRERRLDAIEANLKALLQEVHEMREKPSQHAPEGKLQAK